MAKASNNTRNEIQGNYPSGSMKVIADPNLKKVCDELTKELSKRLEKTMEMHLRVLGINTQRVEKKEANRLPQKTLRETLISERYTGGLPTFFTIEQRGEKVLKTEFMIGALEVAYKNNIPPVRLLAISGDSPLYERINYEKIEDFSGAISDITIRKAKEGKEVIKGRITDKTLVLIDAAISGSIGGEIITHRIEGHILNPERYNDNAMSGTISGSIYTEKSGEKKVIATIDKLPLKDNGIRGKITIDKADEKKLFEFEYDGFHLINDPNFHRNLLQKPVYNIFGELLPNIKLLKSCAAQKLFAYLTLKNSEKEGAEKITAIRDIKSIGMYETFYLHPELKAQNRNQSTIHAVNSCDKCKKVIPVMTMAKQKI